MLGGGIERMVSEGARTWGCRSEFANSETARRQQNKMHFSGGELGRERKIVHFLGITMTLTIHFSNCRSYSLPYDSEAFGYGARFAKPGPWESFIDFQHEFDNGKGQNLQFRAPSPQDYLNFLQWIFPSSPGFSVPKEGQTLFF